MAKKLTEILFPMTSSIHKRVKSGEFDKAINDYGHGCEGCRRFARGSLYIQPAVLDTFLWGTVAASAYGFYLLGSGFFK